MKLVYVLFALFIFGCGKPKEPQEKKSSSNPSYQVELLFDHEGCRVYRFFDYGLARYFANCGTNGAVEHTESCGKGCKRHIEVPSTWDAR